MFGRILSLPVCQMLLISLLNPELSSFDTPTAKAASPTPYGVTGWDS
ncbi:hypothetical protein H175_328p010 (plasmid) [Bacillus thuringiensis serovar thuringiensis str. IS5056]|nr:hypothetical protein H175_328p010 [Bacillus thuringiensis serovar thuringiensis str. IS5056]